MVLSNIEPLAREMAERICRRQGMAEETIAAWVDQHWECAAAMFEAGVMNESGEWIEGSDVLRGIEAYRERMIGEAPSAPTTMVLAKRVLDETPSDRAAEQTAQSE